MPVLPIPSLLDSVRLFATLSFHYTTFLPDLLLRAVFFTLVLLGQHSLPAGATNSYTVGKSFCNSLHWRNTPSASVGQALGFAIRMVEDSWPKGGAAALSGCPQFHKKRCNPNFPLRFWPVLLFHLFLWIYLKFLTPPFPCQGKCQRHSSKCLHYKQKIYKTYNR